jgi:curved DNA-binding protein CbpA
MSLFSSNGQPLLNPYELLGVTRPCTDDECNKAFKKLMLKLHPDKQPAGQTEEEAAAISLQFHNVMDAKSFLVEGEHLAAKRAYDTKLDRLEKQQAALEAQQAAATSAASATTKSAEQAHQEHRKANRRASCSEDRNGSRMKDDRRGSWDCSTTEEDSSSEEDVGGVSKFRERQLKNRDYLNSFAKKAANDTSNKVHIKQTARHQRKGSNTEGSRRKQCSRDNSFAESCSSFFTDGKKTGDPAKSSEQKHTHTQASKFSMDNARSSSERVAKSPPMHSREGSRSFPVSPQTNGKRVSSADFMSVQPPPLNATNDFSSDATVNLSSTQHAQAKKRISDSIDLLAQKFHCPLTHQIINDPMTDFEGNSYERVAILKYLETHTVSPVTGNPLYALNLTPNTSLRERIRCTMQLKNSLDSLGEF